MTLLAVTGAMASTPLFAQEAPGAQDPSMQDPSMSGQSGEMSGGAQAQADKPWADQQASLDAVRKLQQSLNEKGHDAGKEDGLIGPKTESALRDFQQSQGMQATGEIDAETLTALGIDSSEFAAFGIKEDSGVQQSPESMDQGGSAMPESGGAAAPSDVPNSATP
jgi:peptidoglycan hydrolase-like protein with peptidoglycan-binding domain